MPSATAKSSTPKRKANRAPASFEMGASLPQRSSLFEARSLRLEAALLRSTPLDGEEVNVDIKVKQQQGVEDGGFALVFEGVVEFVPPGKEPYATFKLVWLGRYAVKGAAPTEEALQAFSRTVGLNDFWPQLRMHVVSSCAQLRLPAPPIELIPPVQ